MVTKVLQGLLYVSCEMYLDDCIVYASSEDQFLVRLKEVSQRFRERGPLLKAKKCKFGLLCRSRHLSRGSVNIKGQDPVGTQTAEPPRTEIPIGTGELLPGICTKSLVNCKTASRYDWPQGQEEFTTSVDTGQIGRIPGYPNSHIALPTNALFGRHWRTYTAVYGRFRLRDRRCVVPNRWRHLAPNRVRQQVVQRHPISLVNDTEGGIRNPPVRLSNIA